MRARVRGRVGGAKVAGGAAALDAAAMAGGQGQRGGVSRIVDSALTGFYPKVAHGPEVVTLF